jgi:hypothetical protein
MSAQSSVLAPGSQGRSAHNRVGRQNTAWLALAAGAMLVALGAAAINPGRPAATTVAPSAGLTAVPHQALSPVADDSAVQVSGTYVSGTAASGIGSAGVPHQALGEAVVSGTAARGIGSAGVPHQARGEQ